MFDVDPFLLLHDAYAIGRLDFLVVSTCQSFSSLQLECQFWEFPDEFRIGSGFSPKNVETKTRFNLVSFSLTVANGLRQTLAMRTILQESLQP